MNSRRSRSVKLVSARANGDGALEVDVPEEEGDARMSSSAANTVYCCIARGRSVIYRYSSKGGDPQAEATAALCLDRSPPHHRHYVHTSGRRSYGYLTADGHTFFAIIDPSVGSAGALQFLERVRDAFRSSAGVGGRQPHESLVPAVQRLVASLEKMPHAAFVLDGAGAGAGDGDGCTSSSKAPLLGKSGSRKEKRRSRDKLSSSAAGAGAGGCEDEHHGTRAVRIDVMPAEDVGGMSLERSGSQSRLRRQQSSRSLWMRHVKVIVAVDAVVCLVLLAAWLAVCKGFQCVSG
uniref:Longin domain-containing protein n=2 Tax=Zea mays TaxID=4577 RepID=B4FDV9_MAIZE|nr:unknown [Zea mays]